MITFNVLIFGMFSTLIGGVLGFIDPRAAAGIRDLRGTTTELIGVAGVRCIHDPILFTTASP
ncbi:MAG: hypothetical protein OXU68_08725 [Bacteroidota bacterium]|nr:hypothetical protein [Bacteroidota bacterium]